MNIRKTICAGAAVLALSATASTTVSDVVARQRWPWSETVDIDYTLTGDKGDVTFSATWDGQATPVVLGTEFQVEAGQHRFEWCPTNNYAGQTLTGFTVTAEAGDFNAHKYLVLDLVDGGYAFMSAPPAGGWTTEHKSTKMVFARCPAGTYTNGLNNTDLQYVANLGTGFTSTFLTSWDEHVTTFSSDWYISIYAFTSAQYHAMTSGASNGKYYAYSLNYSQWRGETNDTPVVNWPSTKYLVKDGSVVDLLRKKAGGGLCIDLATEEQYETAIRAGTTTFWPTGGSYGDTEETLQGYLNQVVNWEGSSGAGTQEVGLMNANQWGVYDVAGYGGACICLDTAVPSTNKSYPKNKVSGGTDPVGSSYSVGSAYLRRVVKGGGETRATASHWKRLPCARYLGATSSAYPTRLAIHLKPLNFGD